MKGKGGIMSIQSILNPYWNLFLNEEYSGSTIESSLPDSTTSSPVPNSTITSEINSFGNLLINAILFQYNLKYGTNHSSSNFGIVPLNNDQNSTCAYLIYPLLTSSQLIIRVYLELGHSFEIGFSPIKFVTSPLYFNNTTETEFSNTIRVMRCNVLMSPLLLNQYKVIPVKRGFYLPKRILSTTTNQLLFCPIPYNTPLFGVVPDTFNLNRYLPYVFSFSIS